MLRTGEGHNHVQGELATSLTEIQVRVAKKPPMDKFDYLKQHSSSVQVTEATV